MYRTVETKEEKTMADNYLERRMEAYRAQPAAQPRRAATLERLLTRNRSVRGYDARFVVRADQLRSIVSVCTKIPSARNQQVLRFRLVLADEAPGVLAHVRMGGALPELHLPLAGTEPNAFIVVCSTVPEDRWVDIDLGIAVQSMLAPCRRDRAQRALYRRVRPRRDSDEAAAALRTAADPRRRKERRTDRAGRDRRRRRSALLSFGGRPLCPQDSGRGADYRFGFGGNRR